jgi:hypothetical protein
MMKKLFWILLLANVALFVVLQQGWLGGGEPAPQAQPALHEDMIRLVEAPPTIPPAPVLPASVPVKAAVTASSAKPASVAASAPAMAPVAASAVAAESAPAHASDQSNALACLEWGEFTGLDLTRATAALSALQLGDKLTQYQVEHEIGYWVYIPPLRNKTAVNVKIGELKARGIREYFVVQDAGRWRNAISLGVFKTQEAAQRFLDDLRTKDVHTARVGQRASKFNVTIFRLNGVGIMTEVKLTSIQKDFAGSELKRVPCTLTR